MSLRSRCKVRHSRLKIDLSAPAYMVFYSLGSTVLAGAVVSHLGMLNHSVRQDLARRQKTLSRKLPPPPSLIFMYGNLASLPWGQAWK